MITRRQLQTEEFVKILPNLEAVEFLGVANLLGVELFETPTEKEIELAERSDTLSAPELVVTEGTIKRVPRDADLVLEETINKFASISKQKQRELLKVLRPLAKRGAKNGTATNN